MRAVLERCCSKLTMSFILFLAFVLLMTTHLVSIQEFMFLDNSLCAHFMNATHDLCPEEVIS